MRWLVGLAAAAACSLALVGHCTIIMFLAHATQNRLLGTQFHTTQFLLGAVRNAMTPLDGNLLTRLGDTSFSSGTVCTA
jgi:hypothetical protein